MLLGDRFKNDSLPHISLNNFQKNNIKEFLSQVKETDFEKLNCLICSKFSFNMISEKDRYGIYYPTGICINCGNVQQIKYLSHEIMSKFYSKYYNKIYFDFKDPKKRFISQYKLASDKYRFISEYVENIKKKEKFNILEIGCGPGGILKFFQDKGFTVQGVDFDEEHLEYGRKNNLNLLNEKSLNKSSKFDLIILSHVLEHIKDPIGEIKKIKNYLKNDSLIYIEVPSIQMINNMYDSDFLKYLHIAHCYHFSVDSFKNFCSNQNLDILKLNNKIQTLCKVGYQKSNIKLHYSKTMNEIKQLENSYNRYGKLLILKRILRRTIGKILNLLGLKFFFLNLLNYKKEK